jgi:hypothetical protein
MADISLFPVPIDVDPTALAAMGTLYIATEVSLGSDAQGDVLTDAADDSSRCIQQVMRVLLTRKGSVPTEVNFGSNLKSLSTGYNPNTLTEDIVLMLLDVADQCRNKDRLAGVPLSAQLGELELLNLQLVASGQLTITIGVKTVTGISKSFSLAV